MQSPDLTQRILVLDASVLINLLASLAPAEVLSALRAKCIVEEKTLAEIVRHPVKGRDHQAELKLLMEKSLLETVKMSESQYECYLGLVSGDASNALDDGESAAIAIASGLNVEVVLDDRKARRIVGERFPGLQVISSLRFFLESGRLGGIETNVLVKLVNSAISLGRMRIIYDEALLLEKLRNASTF